MKTLLMMLVAMIVACGCGPDPGSVVDGDPAKGQQAIHRHGCGGCHSIPGIAGANGRTGPPLERIRERVYLAGVLPNTPTEMARWIRAPEAVDPRTAMPNLGVTREEAKHITAYLYQLQ